MNDKTKKIIKGIVFGLFIWATISNIAMVLPELYDFPPVVIGQILGYLAFLLFVWYLLYKCQYKWITGLFKKHPSTKVQF